MKRSEKMRKNKYNKEQRTNLRVKRAMALSEIFMFLLSSFAFAFLVGGMAILGSEGVSGEEFILGGKYSYNDRIVRYEGLDQFARHTFTYLDENSNPVTTGETTFSFAPSVSGDYNIEPVDFAQQNEKVKNVQEKGALSSPAPAATVQPTSNGFQTYDSSKPFLVYGEGKQPLKAYSTFEAAKNELQTGQLILDARTKEYLDPTTGKPIAGEADIPTGSAGKKDYTTPWGTSWNTDSYFFGNMVEGLSYASWVLTFTQLIGKFMPEEKGKMVQDIGIAVAAGAMAGKTVYGIFEVANKGKTGTWGTGISVGVGLAVAYLTYASVHKKTQERTASIEFKCMTWQAPAFNDKNTRKTQCNKCNEDPLRPCSEYRCKSLGQSCKLINQGTGVEKCIDGNVDDVTSPGIKVWKAVLHEDYEYVDVRERPPGKANSPGKMTIRSKTSSDGCLKAFTPFEFGIITTDYVSGNSGSLMSQPGQCKIDYNRTKSFDEMAYYMGDTNLYIENHSQVMSMPGTDLLNKLFSSNGSLTVNSNGEYTFYIRCKDGNDNVNEDEFAVRFCIDKTPDETAPLIKAVNPNPSSAVLYKVDNVSVSVFTNEPSQCKWSRKDGDYAVMENNFTCNRELWQMNSEYLYTCKTRLTAIEDKKENQFYFRCADLENNAMAESYSYKLFGTQPLTILSVGPTGVIGSATSTAILNLSVKTDNGYKSGEATCYYSGDNSNYIEMFVTGGNNHFQTLDLANGVYSYYFRCSDAGGNLALNSTTFQVYVDKDAPVVVRTYALEQRIRIITNEESSCRYSTNSCNFDLSKNQGINMPYDFSSEHQAPLERNKQYFIKCSDKYGNSPLPDECSIILMPFQIGKD